MVKQSDGTTITVIKAGHEHFSYYMTEDGVPVVRHSDGDYHYAMVSRKGVLESTGHIAHNRLMRNVAEQTLSENYKTNFMERLEESALSQRYSIGTIDDVSILAMCHQWQLTILKHTFQSLLLIYKHIASGRTHE